MGTPYMGEMKMISWNFAPKGWALCNGQLLAINQNQALFSLFGTTFGGDGRTTFGLPDMRGRAPLHRGAGFVLGQRGGETAHTVTWQEMPMHIHYGVGDTTVAPDPAGVSPGATKRLARTQPGDLYGPAGALTPMNPGMIANTGGSQPHDNMQPFLAVSFIISLFGIYPTQS